MQDVLSDVLRLIRLKSCVYFISDFWSPWGMRIDRGPFAQFHVVVRGRCAVEIDGRRQALGAGDVVLFPRGMGHVLLDGVVSEPVAGTEVVRAIAANEPLFADGEDATRLVCGHFDYDRDVGHPLMEELPDMVHVPALETVAPGSLATVLPLLVRELNETQPGSETIIERLAEVLLIQVIKAHFENDVNGEGFLAAAFDRRLARALKSIHADPAEPISMDALAATAGMSRSAFALHFKSQTGVSPMAYVVKWRMLQARRLLETSALPMAEIAARSGYASDVAFSRAFRRTFGEAPSTSRRSAQNPD
jgi:AraC-like DNA-binding protein